MYGLTDSDKHVVAFHDEKRVILNYMKNYYERYKENLYPFKIKKKNLKKYKDYEDLYLVRYGNIYIQSRYLYVHQIDVEPLIDDLTCAHDVIIRMIEFTNDQKKCKQLSKTLGIIDEEIENLKSSTPKLEELKSRDIDYRLFQYHYNK